ncbi:hypothetical protein PAXRUDRAFT_16751 [Paxillus rubicundulus Ve08.2h10]|uniref:Uncharacterized protein n=1 Tax=Paxillus rubicundulus Ve08.2h10 TaxID=930991 RepID=A0A0D0DKD6_9AGAM|nr:hypothetical protein PAXRUDRAFT_16751 [Paxillus rubicundulus Ve08.2h10]
MPSKWKVVKAGKGDGAVDQSSAAPLCHLSHLGAGHGGAIIQLQKIGEAIESPKKTSGSKTVNIPDEEPVNELAPKKKCRTVNNRKRKQNSQLEEPQGAVNPCVTDNTVPTINPVLHHASPGSRFALQS